MCIEWVLVDEWGWRGRGDVYRRGDMFYLSSDNQKRRCTRDSNELTTHITNNHFTGRIRFRTQLIDDFRIMGEPLSK